MCWVKHQIKEELRGVIVFVGVLWVVYLLNWVVPVAFDQWGITPRTLWGLVGIPLAPFLHANFAHLLGNSIPLTILLTLLAGSRTRTWETVAEITLSGGALLWLFGRPAVHIGASGLIYGLIAFLIVSGLREKRLVPMVVAIFVGFLYGSTLVSGVLPTIGSNVSLDGHLCGAIAGGLIGYYAVSANRPNAVPESA
jgi:membrane associated rhomboid family serine protease